MQGIEPPYTDPYVRWCERSTSQLMASLLLDFSLAMLKWSRGELNPCPSISSLGHIHS